MMRNSIETKIRASAVFIYLLVAVTCCGSILYFYGIRGDIDKKKRNIANYNKELSQINELIYAVNDAQTEVNLFVITGNRKHLELYHRKNREINARIDTLKIAKKNFEVDTILSRIMPLLNDKRKSIVRLNKQFSHHSPINSLSGKLTDLSSKVRKDVIDSIQKKQHEMVPAKKPNKNLIKKIANIFSKSQKESRPVTSDISEEMNPGSRDSLLIDELVDQTREGYEQHILAIGGQVHSMIKTDQYITFRITELLTILYNQIILFRVEEINNDEVRLQKSNNQAMSAAGISMICALICIVLILRNVNKGYKARKALEEANHQNRQLLESRHKLLLSVSHDVKTPLSSMLGYVELYGQKGKLSPEETSPIHHAGSHILDLLNNLLDFSSLEKGSLSLIQHDFTIDKLCNELYEMIAPLADAKSLRLIQKNDFQRNTTIHSDYLKIKQILSNILSNAVKYTKEGSIFFDTSFEANKLTCTVTDTGLGIPIEKRETVFMPFSRIKENSLMQEGSGFGLYVVKGLVDLLGGKINIKSESGKGTEVQVVIPAEIVETQTDQSPKNILVVDDDKLFLEMAAQMCRQLGHNVEACDNYDSFEKMLLHIDDYDLVLSDMEMGDFSGEDLLRKVKQHRKDLAVIVMTGRNKLVPEEFKAKGFSGCLQKPFTSENLFYLIGGTLSSPSLEKDSQRVDRTDEQLFYEQFISEMVKNIVWLRKTSADKDFPKARYICHKILPIVSHLNAPEKITDALRKIDEMGTREVMPETGIWDKIASLADQLELFLEKIQDKYFPD